MRTLRTIRDQLIKAFWYNLIIFPVIAAFYIPYNLFWLQFSPTQLLKWLTTSGLASVVVNFVLRPVNAYATKFIDRRFAKKALVVESADKDGIFAVKEVECEKK